MRATLASVVLSLVLLSALVSATPHNGKHVRVSTPATTLLADLVEPRTPLYTRHVAPAGWVALQKADLTAPLSFTLVLEGSNADALEQRFWEVSDPDHPSYGRFMSNAEIEALVAPSAVEMAVLYSTLAKHGIARSDVVGHGESFEVRSTVAAASSLFSTAFYDFHHDASGHRTIRQLGDCSLPSLLASQVRLVLGVHTFPTVEQRLAIAADRKAKQAAIHAAMADASAAAATVCWVPKALAHIYGVPYPIKPQSTSNIDAAVIEWVQQVFSPTDLALFSNRTATPLTPVSAHHIVGNNTEVPYPGTEASLDIQWIEAVNPGFTPWFWLVSDPDLWMYSWTVQFLTATDYPSIVSLSYGLPELDQCLSFPKSDCNGVDYRTYIHLVDKQFMKIGLIGVSVITATQDRGVYVSLPDPTAALRFTPEYPGSSSYVTSVGATEYINPVFNLTQPPPACNTTQWSCISGGSDEGSVSAAISHFLSSGGFSDVDVTPSYQLAAVQAYLSSNVTLPDKSLFNASGRGSPDVAAIGMNGYVIQAGSAELVSGASMSTPIVAAIIALLQNDFYAITNGTLGFLNPLLYKGQASGARLFKDITVGDNCATQACRGTQDGFSATKGWDPVSGLGSPLYPNMKAYIEKIAHQVVARRAAL